MRIYSAHKMKPEGLQQTGCMITIPSALMLRWETKPLMNSLLILKVSTYEWYKIWGLDRSVT